MRQLLFDGGRQHPYLATTRLGSRLRNHDAAIGGEERLTGQPPAVVSSSGESSSVILRLGWGNVFEEPNTALAARAFPAALGVEGKARLPHGVEEGDTGDDLNLEAHSLERDVNRPLWLCD